MLHAKGGGKPSLEGCLIDDCSPEKILAVIAHLLAKNALGCKYSSLTICFVIS